MFSIATYINPRTLKVNDHVTDDLTPLQINLTITFAQSTLTWQIP